MSPVVRVQAGRAPAVPVPRRVRLTPAELVLAARLAGDVPLPWRGQAGPVPARDRLAERLTSGRHDPADERLAAELRRVDDDGPEGARASLVGRGLVRHDRVDDGVVGALQRVAGGVRSVVVDVAAVRREGDVRLRAWFGVGPGLVAQLTALGDLFELAWFRPPWWVREVARTARVTPWLPSPAPLLLPDHVALPTELLVGAQRAHREHRTDLLPVLAADHADAVRLGERGPLREAGTAETEALLRTLGGACRGRLRLLTSRRDREVRPAVASWLLLDDGWHELRPGPGARTVLRRRDARDLGVLTLPLVREAQ